MSENSDSEFRPSPYHIRHGGLMRCCVASLDEQLEQAREDLPVGTILTCKYCHEPSLIRAADGVWEWNHATTTNWKV